MIKEKKITNGKYQITYSKRFLTVSDEMLKLDYEFEDGFPFSISFSFVNTEEKKPSIKLNSSNLTKGYEFNFVLENFNNTLGTGTIKPISILEKNVDGLKKSIYVGFFAFKHGDAHHILDLNFYEEI